MTIEIKTGVGRIVWGNPAKPQTKKDQQTKQPILKDGQPVNQWVFGVAFPKAEFQRDIWPAMAQEAGSGYPNGTPPKFAWKYQDGDGVDASGNPFANREGYAGCYILTISTEAFAPPIYKLQNGNYVQLTADQIKTGDYVVVALNIKVNVPTDRAYTPGLYINPTAIEHVGYGPEIQNGPDPMALFGGQQRQLPPGASATPVAPQTSAQMPGTMQQPMQQQPMQQQQQPMQQQPMQQQPMQQQGNAAMAPAIAPGNAGNAPMQPGGGYAQTPGNPATGYPSNQQIPPATDFVQNAGMQQQPMQQQPMQQQPQGMPGMMPPR